MNFSRNWGGRGVPDRAVCRCVPSRAGGRPRVGRCFALIVSLSLVVSLVVVIIFSLSAVVPGRRRRRRSGVPDGGRSRGDECGVVTDDGVTSLSMGVTVAYWYREVLEDDQEDDQEEEGSEFQTVERFQTAEDSEDSVGAA